MDSPTTYSAPQPPTIPPVSNKQYDRSAIFITALITFLITSIVIGSGTYALFSKPDAPKEAPTITPQTSPLTSPSSIPLNENAGADPHSLSGKGITITLADKRRIPAGDTLAGYDSRANKDIILLDLFLTAGPECEKGCSTRYIGASSRDYHLTTPSGETTEIGSNANAAFITDPDQFVVMFTGQRAKRQTYFYVSPTEHDFIFRYIGSAFTPSQETFPFSL